MRIWRSRWFVAVATGGLVLAIAALMWCLGSVSGRDIEQPDYFMKPIDALMNARAAIAAIASVVAASTAGGLFAASRKGVGVNAPVLGALVAMGAIIGGGYAVMTAPTIGANIGAGLVIFFAPVLLLVLGAVALRFGLRRGPVS